MTTPAPDTKTLLLLSSYQRMRRYCADASNQSGALTDSVDLRRDFQRWIYAVSKLVENYLQRELWLGERVQYFDVDYHLREFYPKAIPIQSIVAVKHDPTGLFSGAEWTLVKDQDVYIGTNERSIVLRLAVSDMV